MKHVISAIVLAIVLWPISEAAAEITITPNETVFPPEVTVLREWRKTPSDDGDRMMDLLFANRCEQNGSVQAMLGGAQADPEAEQLAEATKVRYQVFSRTTYVMRDADGEPLTCVYIEWIKR